MKLIGAEAITDSCGIMHIGEIPKYDRIEIALREVAANRKVLSNYKAYKLTDTEVTEITNNLYFWEKQVKRLTRKSYDEYGKKRNI